eukprot:10579917-Ditylum_brightwellii.AAC.1
MPQTRSDAALEMRTKGAGSRDWLAITCLIKAGRNPRRISNGAAIPILVIFLSNEISKFKKGAIQKRRSSIVDRVVV